MGRLGFKHGAIIEIIKLSMQSPEFIVIVGGDDTGSVRYGAELRDDRLSYKYKGVRLAISN